MTKINLLIFGILLAVSSFAQTKNFIDQPYIETSASVDTMVIPDRIYLRIVITEKDTKGKTSVEELETKMETKLKTIGIDTKEKLSLHNLASDFERYFLKKQDIMKSKAYTLLVNDAVTAGKVLIELEKMEISNVNVINAEYSGMEKLKLELLAKAVYKAKIKAELMAGTVNQKVGVAIFISDDSEIYFPETSEGNFYYYTQRSLSIKKYEPANISFDIIKVSGEVNVKFKLE